MIYVECKPDEVLVRYLTGLPRRQVIHELKGKAEVCRRISASKDHVGLVDEDPGSVQPPYLSRINPPEDQQAFGIKVFHDISRNNSVVVLCPKLEDWILRAARDAGLSMDSYGLPNTPTALHRVINVDLRKFERLLADLGNAASPRLAALKMILMS